MIRVPLFALLLTALLGNAWADSGPGKDSESDAASTSQWRFEVHLDDRPIGFHHFELRQDGNATVMESTARFEVKVLFVTAYEYAHDNRETWRDQCLQAIDSTTNDNGERYEVTGSAGDGGFALDGGEMQRQISRDCVRSFAYWDPVILESERLLNAQTGEVEAVSVEHLGRTPFDVGGDTVDSEEYLLSTEDGDIRLWYESGTNRWLGLETGARGDRTLRYVPDRLPESVEGQYLSRRGGSPVRALSRP